MRTSDTLSVLELLPAEVEELLRPCNGEAGLQRYVRHLQGMVEPGGIIALDDEHVGRIFRYARYNFGEGGAQAQLIAAFGRLFVDAFKR